MNDKRVLSAALRNQFPDFRQFLFKFIEGCQPPFPVGGTDLSRVIDRSFRSDSKPVGQWDDYHLSAAVEGKMQEFVDYCLALIAILFEPGLNCPFSVWFLTHVPGFDRFVVMGASIGEAMRYLFVVGFNREVELQNRHAPEAIMVTQLMYLSPKVSEVFGNNFDIRIFCQQGIKQFIPGRLDPFSYSCGWAGWRDFPEGIKCPEMIKENRSLSI